MDRYDFLDGSDPVTPVRPPWVTVHNDGFTADLPARLGDIAFVGAWILICVATVVAFFVIQGISPWVVLFAALFGPLSLLHIRSQRLVVRADNVRLTVRYAFRIERSTVFRAGSLDVTPRVNSVKFVEGSLELVGDDQTGVFALPSVPKKAGGELVRPYLAWLAVEMGRLRDDAPPPA